MSELTPDLLLHAYRNGVFPMAHPEAGNEIRWYAPDPRAVLPLDRFHVPKSLRRVVRKVPFAVCFDRDFRGVMEACSQPRPRPGGGVWISRQMIDAYCQLHAAGFAHSVECWQDEQLVGGLYGVCIAGAFFGESMFHQVTDASKVALVHLVEHLRARDFVLLDVQFQTEHLKRFGVIEIARADYEGLLVFALNSRAHW